MPQGFGIFHYGKPVTREQAILRSVSIAKGSDGLADAATAAVAKLARVKAPAVAPASSSNSGTPVWVFVVIAVGGAALLGVMFLFGPRVVRRTPA